MSKELHLYATRFALGEFSADEFAEQFIDKWRRERDSGVLLTDDAEVSERLSSIFCLADLYNPEHDREAYELNESQLRTEVRKILKLV